MNLPPPTRLLSPSLDLSAAAREANRRYVLAGVLAIAAGCAIPLDLSITLFFRDLQHQGPGDLRKAIALFELLGHGLGALLIIIAVAVLDPAKRRRLGQLAACAFGAGSLNLVAKLLIGRTRPHEFWSTEMPAKIGETFLSGSPWPTALHGQLAWDSALQSFPSGHSALAAGLAVGLAHFYPQGRYYFAFLALMVMLQRVQSGAHYPSDTLAGAALGVTVATMCLDPRLFGRWFANKPKCASDGNRPS